MTRSSWLALSANSLVLFGLACDTEPEPEPTSEASQACVPRGLAPGMPARASDYATLCSRLLGQVPTADCGKGVRVPVTVDGVEVFETPADGVCDDFNLKGCDPGSTVRRQEGRASDGTRRPEVVWVTFCRAMDPRLGLGGLSSVQMIGHDMETGATCFFESPDALGVGAQGEWVSMNEDGLLDGELPGPDHPDFDRAFATPPSPCSECHQNDPFIHSPWIDGARLPEDPSQPVVPTLAAADSPYWVVGGPRWDLRTPHIEGNTCTRCHRVAMGTSELFADAHRFDINEIMPPYDPGSEAGDLAALRACWERGPEAMPGCEWVNPPGAYCED